MGRPPKFIDQEQFEKLCGLQCTREEICGFFDVSHTTLDKWCMKTYGETFLTVFKAKRQLGKISLRRTMWKSALKGNTALQIFLSKNFLGMSDTVKVEANADGKLADLIEGLKEPLNYDLHEEATGANGLMADK